MSLEDWLGFPVDYRKLAFWILVLLVVGYLVIGTVGGNGGREVTETTSEQEFRQKVESGEIQPVTTDRISVTEEGLDPRFVLISLTSPDVTSQVTVKNRDSREHTVVIGESDVRQMSPGQQFTLTFGSEGEIEIRDETTGVSGKIFVRRT